MKRRDISLLKLLAKQNDFLTSEQICSAIGIRPRTLREDLKSYRKLIDRESGARIESKSNQGYRLIIEDEKKFFEFMQAAMKEEQNNQYLMPVSQEGRVNYILRYLLGRNEATKSDDLADVLYISRSTLSADLKVAKEYLSHFYLTLESRVGEGLVINGDEQDIRSCIAHYFFHVDDFDETQLKSNPSPIFNAEMFDDVRADLYEIIVKNQFKMTDMSFQNLIIHILIALHRVRSKPETILMQNIQSELQNAREWRIAEQIARRLEHRYDLTFPAQEIGYITIHLLGKKAFDKDDDRIIDVRTLNLVRDVLSGIKDQYHLDFYGDVDLFTMLSLHIQPLLSRITYGLRLHNPLIERIKSENSLAFEIAVTAGFIISSKLDKSIDESEIAYLALHFQLALERSYQKSKKRILIVCASGAGTSQILLYKVQSFFINAISKVDLLSARQFEMLDDLAYDLLLTTVPLKSKFEVPMIQVSYLLDAEDIYLIESTLQKSESELETIKQCFKETLYFSNQRFTDRDDLIRFMVKKLECEIDVPHDFLASILERENLASTALGNSIALPHPMKLMLEENVIVVCHLEQPILWDKQYVDWVFLLGIKKREDDVVMLLGKTLTELIHQPGLLNRLRTNPEYTRFIELIFEQFIQQKRQRSQSIFS